MRTADDRGGAAGDDADGRDRPAMLGDSLDRCPWRIAALSLPILGALLFAARRQAPTALRRAGAAAGLAAGGTAAIANALACTEQSPAFVLVWYSFGLALTTGIGALVEPSLLRWWWNPRRRSGKIYHQGRRVPPLPATTRRSGLPPSRPDRRNPIWSRS